MNARLRFLDLGTSPDDDPDLRARKRTAVAIGGVAAVAPVVFAAAGLRAGRPEVVVLAAAHVVLQLANLAAFRRHRRIGPFVVLLMVIGMLTILIGSISLGGVRAAGDNIVWTTLAPIGAVLLLGRRAALPSLAFFAVVVIAAVVADPLASGGPELPPEAILALTAFNVIVPGALILAIVAYIDNQRTKAKAESDALLLNVLPRSIADRLKAGEENIADACPDVTVLFSDVVDFTPLAEAEDPARLVQVLDDLFTSFDRLAESHRLEKIKTIGDAYMVVAGVPEERVDHARVMIEMALAMHRAVAAHPPIDGRQLEIRTGIATGPVVAGVIGQRKFSYDLWGDTVNVASRMESSGIAGCIQVTPETHERCEADYPWQRRDGVEVKGKGPMTTWLLDPRQVATG